jgi:hypothetical protein
VHFGHARRSDLASRRAFFALLQSYAFKRSMGGRIIHMRKSSNLFILGYGYTLHIIFATLAPTSINLSTPRIAELGDALDIRCSFRTMASKYLIIGIR